MVRIVWKRFKWQKLGRFWLYYFHPATGGYRYAKLSDYFKIKYQVVYAEGWDAGFRAGKMQ